MYMKMKNEIEHENDKKSRRRDLRKRFPSPAYCFVKKGEEKCLYGVSIFYHRSENH